MDHEYFNGLANRGALREMIDYVSKFPEEEWAIDMYDALFVRQDYSVLDLPKELEPALTCYLDYFREVFYLEQPESECDARLLDRLRKLFPEDPDAAWDDLKKRLIPDYFAARGWCIDCGRVNGYHNPFIWHTTEWKTYDVELPDGLQTYTMRLCREHLLTGFKEYISLGAYAVGGWVLDDGIINCFIDTYDVESEDFTVSLLKHEAQHVRDLENWPDISDGYLEYRAFLVELIYCTERNRLTAFAHMAAPTPENDHAAAAYDIVHRYAEILETDDFASIPIPTIREIALELFQESDQALIDTFGSKE